MIGIHTVVNFPIRFCNLKHGETNEHKVPQNISCIWLHKDLYVITPRIPFHNIPSSHRSIPALSISADNLAPYFTGKNIHMKILFPLNMYLQPQSFLSEEKKLTLQLYFLPPMSSALTICAFPSTSKHTLQKTKPKTFPYTHVVLADSISQIVLSFLCTFLLSSQPLHIAGPWLHLKHSTFIHKNLLGWFYSVS